jgi:hypothetical protein
MRKALAASYPVLGTSRRQREPLWSNQLTPFIN